MNMATHSHPVICTSGLTRRFGDKVAVNDLTLEIDRGEIFGFLGHNGAGKTTTIRLLNGVLSASAGTARVLGLSPWRDGPALRQHTGVLTETPALDERLTARQTLRTYADLYNVTVNQVNHRVTELLELFDLSERADERVGAYSRGMQQRLALARALLHDPEILFLDEPTSGLDPVAARQVNDLITTLSREGRVIFLCTHNLSEAQRLCDRVAVMRHGQLIALGTPAELARQVTFSAQLSLEVAPEQIAQARDILSHTVPMSAIAATETTLTVTCADRENIPDLLATLVSRDVRVYQLYLHEPALEEVYFKLQDTEEVTA